MDPKTLELRSLIDNAGAGKKCCSICGKPESKNTKSVNENCPAHKAAVDTNLPAQYRMLSRALGNNVLDFITREKFNAQLEYIRAKLLEARKEHDAYTPETKVESDRKALIRVLTTTLGLLNVKLATPPMKPAEEGKEPEAGEWSPLDLAGMVEHECGVIAALWKGLADEERVKSGNNGGAEEREVTAEGDRVSIDQPGYTANDAAKQPIVGSDGVNGRTLLL